jgi:hypothetical protein
MEDLGTVQDVRPRVPPSPDGLIVTCCDNGGPGRCPKCERLPRRRAIRDAEAGASTCSCFLVIFPPSAGLIVTYFAPPSPRIQLSRTMRAAAPGSDHGSIHGNAAVDEAPRGDGVRVHHVRLPCVLETLVPRDLDFGSTAFLPASIPTSLRATCSSTRWFVIRSLSLMVSTSPSSAKAAVASQAFDTGILRRRFPEEPA